MDIFVQTLHMFIINYIYTYLPYEINMFSGTVLNRMVNNCHLYGLRKIVIKSAGSNQLLLNTTHVLELS